MLKVMTDEKCKTCFFYGLCTKSKLPHCEGESYVKVNEPDEAN